MNPLAWPLLCAVLGQPVPPSGAEFDPASIACPRNLVSNASFEANRVLKSQPDGWEFYANRKYMSLASDGALHGKHSVVVDRPALAGIVHVAARQTVPIVPGQEYTLSAWVKVERSNHGSVSIYLDFLDAHGERLLIRQATEREATDGWKLLRVSARAPQTCALARLLVPYVDGDMRVRTDAVALTSDKGGRPRQDQSFADLSASGATGSSVYLSWASTCEHHEVFYRACGQADWTVIRNVWSKFHNVIMLQAETEYEFKIACLPPELIDENGKSLSGAAWESPVIRARTTKAQPKQWEGLKLWPTAHVPTFPDGQCYPCIEHYKGACYLVEVRNSALYLSRLREADFSVEWTRPIVPAMQKPSCYQGIPDTCVWQDKLWVMWNRQATGDPNYRIMDSRQLVITYDFATGKLSEPILIKSTKPGCGTWEGGLTVFQGRLWMMWMEVWLDGPQRRRTRIVLRPYEQGRFAGTVVFENCPSVYPYGPSINMFDERMILLWSDLAVNERDAQSEPLYCTFFDGRTFSASTKIHAEGRSRYAKGAQLGGDFYCVYKCNAQHSEHGYLYPDLALTRIGPDAKQVATTYWVDDVKYNSSPDMIAHGDGLVAVYGKFEHAYGNRNDPALCHGTFLGRITR